MYQSAKLKRMQKLRRRYHYSVILLRQLVITDFKLRYQGSVLGYLWSLLRPLALFVILYFVFAKFLRVGEAVPYYPVYLLLGIVLWNYYLEVTSNSVASIVGRGDLIRKINFPKYVIVLAGSFSALINLFLNFIIIIIFMLLTGTDISSGVVWLPLLILEMFIFSLGTAFLLSAAFVKFRDISYIWEVIMQGAFYATPILYPLSYVIDNVSVLAAKILMLNPMAQIIQDIREVIITDKTITMSDLYGSNYSRIIPLAIVLFLALFSTYYFRKRSKYFAEEV